MAGTGKATCPDGHGDFVFEVDCSGVRYVTGARSWFLRAICDGGPTVVARPHIVEVPISRSQAKTLRNAGAEALEPVPLAQGGPKQPDGKPFVPATFPHVPASSALPSPFGPVAADQKTLQRGVAALLTACRPPAGPEDPGELAGHVDRACEAYDAAIGRAKADAAIVEAEVLLGRVPGCAGRDRHEALRARVAFLVATRAAGVAALTGGRW